MIDKVSVLEKLLQCVVQTAELIVTEDSHMFKNTFLLAIIKVIIMVPLEHVDLLSRKAF